MSSQKKSGQTKQKTSSGDDDDTFDERAYENQQNMDAERRFEEEEYQKRERERSAQSTSQVCEIL